MVGPSVYDTIQSFLSAIVGQDVSKLVELADPKSAIPRQVDDFKQLESGNELKLVSLHADDEWALAVTSDVVVVDDEDREQGPLVITLVKRDDLWLVTDVDLETEATVNDELDRFFNNHPNAVEISLR